jgi:ribosomal protein S18 acetylase RimI-like enzyme
MIRKADESDLKGLAKLYKEVFSVHNIFEKSESEIAEYLIGFENILVAEEDGKIVGGLVIAEKQQDSDWKLFNFKHIAVSKDFQDKGIGSALIEGAENAAGKGKVEINVGERESGSLVFYKKMGYEQEAELKSHYRKGESCFVMGKVLE